MDKIKKPFKNGQNKAKLSTEKMWINVDNVDGIFLEYAKLWEKAKIM